MPNSKLKVISSDGQEFKIDYDVAKQSKLLKLYFDEDIDEPVLLSEIKASILAAPDSIDDDDDDDDDDNAPKKNISQPKRTTVISEWDRKFVQQFTIREEKLFDIIIAANYLGVNTLIHVFCRTYISMIRGKTSEEIQALFKLADALDETTNSTSQIDLKKN